MGRVQPDALNNLWHLTVVTILIKRISVNPLGRFLKLKQYSFKRIRDFTKVEIIIINGAQTVITFS